MDEQIQTWLKAAEHGEVETLEQIASTGFPVDASCEAGWTALHHGALNGHISVVQKLLHLGANPNVTNIVGITPLMVVSWEERIAKVLMIYGPSDCLAREEPDRARIASLLLRSGAQPNQIDAAFRSALYYACANLQKGVVSELLRSGADPNLADFEDQLPVQAVRNGWEIDFGWTEGHADDAQEFEREQNEILKLLASSHA